MDGTESANLLDELAATVEARWQQAGEDRELFFRALRWLQRGDAARAARLFRRASRHCDEPFATMARMARGRCEVVGGRQGAALRAFEKVADSDGPPPLRRMAWMEIADLARQRQDASLLERARDALGQLQVHS